MADFVSGKVLTDDGFIDGYVEFENGSITEVGEGKHRGKSLASGIVIPFLTSCHTHIGDACLRGKIDAAISLEELVKPPTGLKHVLLAEQDESAIVKGMGIAIDEMRFFGVGRYIDFREGGLKGLAMLKKAVSEHPYPVPTILSRPENLAYSKTEVDELLASSDGIGISAMKDWPYDQLELVASHTKRMKKMLAMHASESIREEISKVLELKPDLLVHLSVATRDDLSAVNGEGIPVAVCPRSNSRFGIKLDIARMIDTGLTVCLGTDNAMLNNLSVIDEMRAAYSLKSNSRPLSVDEVFNLAISNPRKVLSDKSVITMGAGKPCEFMVVRAGNGGSIEELLRPKDDYMIELVSRGTRIWKSAP